MKTHSGQYMHDTSNQPEHVKVDNIKTLVRGEILFVALKSHYLTNLITSKHNLVK